MSPSTQLSIPGFPLSVRVLSIAKTLGLINGRERLPPMPPHDVVTLTVAGTRIVIDDFGELGLDLAPAP